MVIMSVAAVQRSELRLALRILKEVSRWHNKAKAGAWYAYLEEAIEFCREHHVSLCLEFPGHERLLPSRLAIRNLDERLVLQKYRHVRLEAQRLCLPLFHRARLLQVDGPCHFLPCVILDIKFKDAVVLRSVTWDTSGSEFRNGGCGGETQQATFFSCAAFSSLLYPSKTAASA